MNTIRSLHPYRLVLSALLAVASVAGMLFQPTPTALAANHPDISEPASQNSALQSAPGDMFRENKNLGVTASDAQGITLELSTPDFTVEQKSIAGQTCQAIHIEGYSVTDEPGWPELPVRGAMLGIPVQSNPTLVVIEARPVVIQGKFRLCPVEAPILDQKLPGDLPPYGMQPAWNAQAYDIAGFQPPAAAELVATAYLRDQRIAQMRWYPFQYNPASGELRYFAHITARLAFNEAPQTGNQPGSEGIPAGAFDELLQDTLINYQQASAWRLENTSSPTLQSNRPAEQQPAYKLFVEQDGLYQVTYAALAAVAGEELQPGQASNTFRLFSGGDFTRGQEVAIQVLDGEDGSFDPGDAILFYGQAVNTQYTGANVYYLTWGSVDGLRMATVDSTPTGSDANASFSNTVHLEQNAWYLSDRPSGASKDVWYWDYIQDSGSKTYTVTLESIATSSPNSARVRGMLRSYQGDPKHHTMIYLNGYLIDDALWANGATYFFDKEAPQNYLLEGVNTITVETLMDNGIASGIVLINWFEIDYQDEFVAENDQLNFTIAGDGLMNPQTTGFSTGQLEAFDITNPNQPARLVNFSTVASDQGYSLTLRNDPTAEHVYIAQSPARRLSPQGIVRDNITDLHSTDNAADYIVISHADFLSAVQPLADWRAAQGLRTQVVDVADIYDEFSGGLMSPQAIHDFLAYAYANWQSPAPLYVVLIGDGHYDPRNYLGSGGPVFIPPYLEFVDQWVGETASENRFVTVSGDDYLPDMFIGRLPVTSQAQASSTVAKIIAYEQNPAASNWNSNVLFVADNADFAGNFPAYSDEIVNGYLPADYSAKKVYYKITHTTVSSARIGILNGINEGALIVNYVGHGYSQGWASENLFTNAAIASLSNPDKLPFVVAMSCLVGSFHVPDFGGFDLSALAEKLVVSANSGAIATFASTGMGLSGGQDYLDRGLFQAIFSQGHVRVGAATTQAKLFLYANTGAYQDLIDSFAVLGDPATRLNVLSNPDQASLLSLEADAGPAQVDIFWTTEFENDNLGFNVYRAVTPEGLQLKVNPALIPTRVLKGMDGADYTFTDDTALPGVTYYYWIEFVGDGSSLLSQSVSAIANWPVYLPLLWRQ